MEPKISSLAIQRFRSLKDLKIEGMGRVNLITGKNNTGKSSVLEAIRILASEASPYVISDILRFREEDADESMESFFRFSSLFLGFPQFSASINPILIISTGQRAMNISIGAGWYVEERDETGLRRVLKKQQGLFGEEEEGAPGLVIKTEGKSRILSLTSNGYRRIGSFRPDYADNQLIPCQFVSPFGGEFTRTLGYLWDKIALTDNENDVVDALRIIDPQIQAVSMVGAEGSQKTRKAIVRVSNIYDPVSLRSFGDGLNRLFGIILSLVNSKDGLLLIDEFENGLHYSVQVDVWRVIFKLANRLDIQVVATSHSWDAIEAFQQAASEVEDEGVLIRLTRRGEEIIPTVFREDELAIVTRDHIEVR